MYEPANKAFESDLVMSSGQAAVNGGVQHSYDLRVVHGV